MDQFQQLSEQSSFGAYQVQQSDQIQTMKPASKHIQPFKSI